MLHICLVCVSDEIYVEAFCPSLLLFTLLCIVLLIKLVEILGRDLRRDLRDVRGSLFPYVGPIYTIKEGVLFNLFSTVAAESDF